MRLRVLALAPLLALQAAVATGPRAGEPAAPPNVLLVTIDTLRADRLGAYGYDRPTSPNLDRLIAAGAKFEQARTVEPLTGPALVSMLTSRHPHEHGASRNGLRMRSGLVSLPKVLQAHGYRTAAFVGNWTLRDKLTGLAEHFDLYEEILTRKRWLGLVRGEATADDLTAATLEWIDGHVQSRGETPFLLWVHYVEPHAPYREHPELTGPLGYGPSRELPASARYDTEVAFVDASIGRLLHGLADRGLTPRTLVVFASDHGESLGEHGEWGHGRNLFEPALRIPMSLTWPGRIGPRTISAPALLIDLGPTVLGLLGHRAPRGFDGYDWTDVLRGAEPPYDRVTRYQTHRGAVISRHDSDLARRSGLLEVGVLQRQRKELFRIESGRRSVYDLQDDPLEQRSSSAPKEPPTEGLLGWMRTIYDQLTVFDDDPPAPLDEESIERLRSLGYVD